MVTADSKLQRVNAPENLGISSQAVLKTLKRLEKTMVFHSFMIVRHGKIAAECYRYPFRSDIPHTMYSVSKTISAIALGFAVSEGLVSLDSRLTDVFPDFVPKQKDERFERLCVKHLVTLTAGKITNPLQNKTKDDWLEQYLNAKWVAEPGERFDYVNEAMYTLCAVVQKVTGQTVVDFLYPRLFEPLGIEKPFWETDPRGVESGGWGIYLKTEDFSKIMYCYLNRGMWFGKQVIPEQWAVQAVQPQGFYKGKAIDGDCYGYGIWVVSDNEFRARGMFDQLSCAIIDKDTVITVTSCNNDEAPFWTALEDIKGELYVDEDPAAVPSDEYVDFISSLRLDEVPVSTVRSGLEKELQGRTIHFKKSFLANVVGFPVSVINVAALFMEKNRAGNIDNAVFTFGEDGGTFRWSENDETNTVDFGMDGKYRYTRITLAGIPLTAASCAFWTGENELELWIRPVESIAKRIMHFSFDGKKVRMKPLSDPPMQNFVECIAGTIEGMFKAKPLKSLAKKALVKFRELLEHEHKGKITK